MTNTQRGETGFLANGESFVMKLTLGALAEIENVLNIKNLPDLSDRMKQFGTSDIAAVAAALLRAGGHSITATQVLSLPVELATIVGAISDAFSPAKKEGDSPLSGAGVSNSASAS